MGSPTLTALGLSGLEAVLTVVTTVGIYVVVIVLSRLRGQRQFSTTSTYDLAFIFPSGRSWDGSSSCACPCSRPSSGWRRCSRCTR